MKNIKLNVVATSILLVVFTFFTACEKEEVVENKSTTVETSEKESTVKTIELSNEQKEKVKINTLKIETSSSKLTIQAPAIVSPAPDYFFVVSAPVNGRVVSLFAHEGEAVQKGQLIIEIESSQFGNLIAEFLQSKSEEKYAKENLDRITKLIDKKISSASEYDRASADYIRAQASANASYSKLKSIGISNTEITNLVEGKNISTRLKIYSPITGVIDQHLVEMGQAVNEYQKLATIINPVKVLVKGYVSPSEGNYVKVGDKVTISLKNDLVKSIDGKIATINPGLDENNKSIVVNVLINTKNGWPRTGENVKLNIISSANSDAILIPLSAVVFEENSAVVFVKVADGKYEKRIIVIEEINSNNAIVSSGLKANEEIAISELFTLKALSRFDEFSE